MDITTKSLENGTIVEITFYGRIDIATKEIVSEALKKAVNASASIVVADLQNVPLIDSSGLSAMVSGLRLAREQQKDIVLAGLNKHSQMVFSLTMMDKVFSVFASVQDALEAYHQQGTQIV